MAQRTCSVEGCGKPARRRGWCGAHHQRWLRHGDPLRGGPLLRQGSSPDGLCLTPDCDRPVVARGWCAPHYQRWCKDGDVRVDAPIRRFGTPAPPCSVEECDKPARKHGMCPTHADRVRHYGDPLHGHQPQDGENNHNWRGDAIATYGGMHARLKYLIGRARDFPCVDCGNRADDWSYIGPCPDERLSTKGRPWCTHIECFTTRCRSCHGLFDARRNSA